MPIIQIESPGPIIGDLDAEITNNSLSQGHLCVGERLFQCTTMEIVGESSVRVFSRWNEVTEMSGIICGVLVGIVN